MYLLPGRQSVLLGVSGQCGQAPGGHVDRPPAWWPEWTGSCYGQVLSGGPAVSPGGQGKHPRSWVTAEPRAPARATCFSGGLGKSLFSEPC